MVTAEQDIDGNDYMDRWARAACLLSWRSRQTTLLPSRAPHASLIPPRTEETKFGGRSCQFAQPPNHRWHHRTASPSDLPRRLARKPAIESRHAGSGRRRGLDDDPDDVVGRQRRAGADRTDAAGNADLDAGRCNCRHV